ncbi:hypothetical protein L1987_20816 [Smallanthus sonchifolius]|uniref:Uncharacterized protein n=1 Tax=Smallanthus sonchifolius TaxID=185202 RepID=A0ACB9IUQ0_9ASTR|nr:hypothetical protein L1987_20816 [Smallanthus sonchifolius]
MIQCSGSLHSVLVQRLLAELLVVIFSQPSWWRESSPPEALHKGSLPRALPQPCGASTQQVFPPGQGGYLGQAPPWPRGTGQGLASPSASVGRLDPPGVPGRARPPLGGRPSCPHGECHELQAKVWSAP